jgi:hypothetical protein
MCIVFMLLISQCQHYDTQDDIRELRDRCGEVRR